MTPYVLLLCTGLVTLAAAESLQTACWQQDVSSWAWRYHEEMVNVLATGTATSMDVETEHYDVSESLCKKNETFGFTETKLWVSGGCRATFTVCYDQSNTFDAKINAMKNEFNYIKTEQQTQIERLEGIVNTLNATVTEMDKDEAVDNQDTVELSNGLTLQYDNINDEGPWLIFQHRVSGDVDFNLGWADYREGFGNTENYWMGLDLVYSYCNVTNQCKLRVDLARNGVAKYAMYKTFYLDGPAEDFTIHLAGYSGDAGDAMIYTDDGYSANGMKFSTADSDNDLNAGNNIADKFGAPWWWNFFAEASLNGVYGGDAGFGPFWHMFADDYDALTSTAMKLSQIPQ